MAHSARTSDPSPFTTIKGAAISKLAMVLCSDEISSVRGGIRCALRAVVVALRIAFS
jgi:hypothetical protein